MPWPGPRRGQVRSGLAWPEGWHKGWPKGVYYEGKNKDGEDGEEEEEDGASRGKVKDPLSVVEFELDRVAKVKTVLFPLYE